MGKLKNWNFMRKHKKWEKKSFNKKMKEWLTWHIPFTKDNKNYYENNGDRDHYCPNCSSNNIKNNGEGFFRCRECGKRFIILEAIDDKKRL